MERFNSGVALFLVLLVSSIAPAAAQSGSADWSGYYAGAFIGYNDMDFDAVYRGPAVGLPLPFDQDVDSYSLGAYAGYNWQRGRYVYGPEFDLGWQPDASSSASPGGAAAIDVKVTGRVRGRLGYLAQDNLLLYGGLGLAVSDAETTRVPAASTPVYRGSEVMYGLSAGIGAEYAVSKRTRLRVEYIYDRYFDQKIANTEPNGGIPFFPEIKTDVDSHTIRFGVTIALN